MAAGKATIVYSFLHLQRYFEKRNNKTKKLYVISRKRAKIVFWVGPISKKLQTQNFDMWFVCDLYLCEHKIWFVLTQIHLLQISSFFHLSSLASFTDSRLRCGNKQKFLWCRRKMALWMLWSLGYSVGRPDLSHEELPLNPKTLYSGQSIWYTD